MLGWHAGRKWSIPLLRGRAVRPWGWSQTSARRHALGGAITELSVRNSGRDRTRGGVVRTKLPGHQGSINIVMPGRTARDRLDDERSWLQRMHMIEDTLAKIEARLGKAGVLAKEQRTELLGLLSTLKTEIGEFSKTHSEQAQSITAFTRSVHARSHAPGTGSATLATLPGGIIGFSPGF